MPRIGPSFIQRGTRFEMAAGKRKEQADQVCTELCKYIPFRTMIQHEIDPDRIEGINVTIDRRGNWFFNVNGKDGRTASFELTDNADQQLINAAGFLLGKTAELPNLKNPQGVRAKRSESERHGDIDKIFKEFKETQIGVAQEHTKQIEALCKVLGRGNEAGTPTAAPVPIARRADAATTTAAAPIVEAGVANAAAPPQAPAPNDVAAPREYVNALAAEQQRTNADMIERMTLLEEMLNDLQRDLGQLLNTHNEHLLIDYPALQRDIEALRAQLQAAPAPQPAAPIAQAGIAMAAPPPQAPPVPNDVAAPRAQVDVLTAELQAQEQRLREELAQQARDHTTNLGVLRQEQDNALRTVTTALDERVTELHQRIAELRAQLQAVPVQPAALPQDPVDRMNDLQEGLRALREHVDTVQHPDLTSLQEALAQQARGHTTNLGVLRQEQDNALRMVNTALGERVTELHQRIAELRAQLQAVPVQPAALPQDPVDRMNDLQEGLRALREHVDTVQLPDLTSLQEALAQQARGHAANLEALSGRIDALAAIIAQMQRPQEPERTPMRQRRAPPATPSPQTSQRRRDPFERLNTPAIRTLRTHAPRVGRTLRNTRDPETIEILKKAYHYSHMSDIIDTPYNTTIHFDSIETNPFSKLSGNQRVVISKDLTSQAPQPFDRQGYRLENSPEMDQMRNIFKDLTESGTVTIPSWIQNSKQNSLNIPNDLRHHYPVLDNFIHHLNGINNIAAETQAQTIEDLVQSNGSIFKQAALYYLLLLNYEKRLNEGTLFNREIRPAVMEAHRGKLARHKEHIEQMMQALQQMLEPFKPDAAAEPATPISL